ncbi:TPA: HIRAN domain-containing protein [Streptococcus suis]
MIYKEHFLVVGISYRKANLKKILEFLEYDYEFGQYKENGYLEPKNFEYYTQKMSLEREPENGHDKNAIKVMVGNIHLGYVPKKLARKMAKLLDNGYNYISELELMDDANGNYDIGIVNVILYNSETLPDIPPKNIQNLNGEIVPLKKEEIDIPETEMTIPEVIEEKNINELQMAGIGCLIIIFICVFFYSIFN